MTDEELIKDIVRDKKIMYASREAGIKCYAETYSFNIESVLFNQLTLEQQELWRKEIENAVINGGEMGLELANDKRYDKELSKNLEEEIEKIDDQYPVEIQYIREIARHFAEWGRKHFENKSKIMSEDLEEAAEKYAFPEGKDKYGIEEAESNGIYFREEKAKHFKAGAKWADQHPRKGLWDAEKVRQFLRDNTMFGKHPAVFEEFIKNLTQYIEE